MSEQREIRFVKALLVANACAHRGNMDFRINIKGGRTCTLPQARVSKLISDGVLTEADAQIYARPEARSWLRRKLLSANQAKAKAAPAKVQVEPRLNLAESPLARLSQSKENGQLFLSAHHVEAGERMRQLVERAHLIERTTMSYDPTRFVDKGPASSGGGISEMGQDARNKLYAYLDNLPKDSAAAVLNVCGYLKGLQMVEAEQNWPRRSGKMILRIGLELLAQQMGLSEKASGRATAKMENWREPGAVPHHIG